MDIIQTKQTLPLDEIRAFCQAQPIQRLAFFGSAARGEASPSSDIDLLVEYLPKQKITYFDMSQHEMDLTAIIGREVHLLTAEEISHHFRQEVLEIAEILYEKRA